MDIKANKTHGETLILKQSQNNNGRNTNNGRN